MASAQTIRCSTKQLFLLGTKHNTKPCITQLLGIETAENRSPDLWTVYRGKTLSNDVMMTELKEHDLESSMECQEDLDLCNTSNTSTSLGKRDFPGSSSQSLPKMKRLKSTESSCNTDNGYESDNAETYETEVLVDVHVIVLDDEKELNRRIVPFIVQFFLLPAVFVIAVDSESSKKGLYKDVIKEIGVHARMKQDESSKLLVVNVPSHDAQEVNNKETPDHINKLQFAILDYHFGEHFFSCQINELFCEVNTLLRETDALFKEIIGRKTGKDMFERQDRRSIFLDKRSTSTNEEIAFLVKNKYFPCIRSGNKEYFCKPEDLVNEFLRVMTVMPSLEYDSSSFEVMKSILKPGERKILIDAFEQTGLIRKDAETCYILPLISCENLPRFDDMDCTYDNNAIRLTVDTEIIPALVMSKILLSILSLGWALKSTGPKLFGATVSYLFEVYSHGLVVLFQSSKRGSYIYLCGLRFTSRGECNCFVESDNRVFETLRENVEAELEKFRAEHTSDGCQMSITGRHIQVKGGQRQLAKDCNEWLEVDLQNDKQMADLTMKELLWPWFTSKAEEIEEEMSRRLSDSFLSDISELFGHGYKLFFVSLDVPSERLSQIELQNKTTQITVYEMLLEWRKRNGLRASIITLRSAIKNSTHVTVNLYTFDEIVKRHGLN